MTDYCHCDYDIPEFYVLKIRRARKLHRCDECGGTIAAGEKYEHIRAKWENHIVSFNT